MLSGIFRGTLWNQTIPDSLRGRLAGVELLSYGLGPSAGQIRAGAVASITTPRFSLWSGGLLCAVAVAAVCVALPGFVLQCEGRRAQRVLDRAVEGRVGVDHLPQALRRHRGVHGQGQHAEHLAAPRPGRRGPDQHAAPGVLDQLDEAVVARLVDPAAGGRRDLASRRS